MIIKITSTQTKDPENYPGNNGKPYKIIDTDFIFPKSYRKKYLQTLKENKKAGLLDFEIIDSIFAEV